MWLVRVATISLIIILKQKCSMGNGIISVFILRIYPSFASSVGSNKLWKLNKLPFPYLLKWENKTVPHRVIIRNKEFRHKNLGTQQALNKHNLLFFENRYDIYCHVIHLGHQSQFPLSIFCSLMYVLAGICGLNKQTPFQKVWLILSSLNFNPQKTELLCKKLVML